MERITVIRYVKILFLIALCVPISNSYAAEKLILYTAMAREEGWGKDIPEKLRNENWNYAIFTTDKQHRPGVNQAECLACHKPLDNVSYTFTLKQLAGAK